MHRDRPMCGDDGRRQDRGRDVHVEQLHVDGREGWDRVRDSELEPGRDQLWDHLFIDVLAWHPGDIDTDPVDRFDVCGVVGWWVHRDRPMCGDDGRRRDRGRDVHVEHLHVDGREGWDRVRDKIGRAHV